MRFELQELQDAILDLPADGFVQRVGSLHFQLVQRCQAQEAGQVEFR